MASIVARTALKSFVEKARPLQFYVGEPDTLFLIEPEVRFYGRHRLRRDLAWEAMGTVLTTLGSGKKGNGVPLAVGLQSGPLLQRGHVALRARAGIVWTHGPVHTVPCARGQRKSVKVASTSVPRRLDDASRRVSGHAFLVSPFFAA